MSKCSDNNNRNLLLAAQQELFLLPNCYLIILSHDTNLLFMSDAYSKLINCQNGEFQNDEIFDNNGTCKIDFPVSYQELTEITNTHKAITKYQQISSENTLVTLKWSVSLRCIQGTNLFFLYGNDYSANATDANSLIEIESYLKSIISCMPGNVYWMDKDLKYLGCNDNVAKMHHLDSPDKIVGMSYDELAATGGWDDSQEQVFKEIDLQVINTGEAVFNVEEPPIIGPEGRLSYFLTSRVPLTDASNKVAGVVGISIDITDLHNAREENEKLKIEEKSRQLSLVQKIMTELRTPLNNISVISQLLLNNTSNISDKENFDIIYESTQDIEKILSQVLQYLTIEPPKDVGLQGQNIREILEDIIVKQYPNAKSKKNDIILHCHNNLPYWCGFNPKPVQEVIDLLIANAIRFTESGAIVCEAWVDAVADESSSNGILHIRVLDSGCGISHDKQKELFTFYEDRTDTIGIAGFSLSRANRTLEQMKGHLACKSELGEGSSFSITLPVRLMGNDNTAPIEAIDLSSYRILLIDNLDIRGKTIENMLSTDNVTYINESKLPISSKQLNEYEIFIINETVDNDVIAQLLTFLQLHPTLDDISVYILSSKDQLSEHTFFTNTPVPIYLIKKPLLDKHFLYQLVPVAHVLVVEDNPGNMKVMKLFFKQLGIRADYVTTITAAKEQLYARLKDYYCVFTDISLPDGRGIELAEYVQEIKTRYSGYMPRLFATTAHASDDEIESYLSNGFINVLPKPIQISELQKILKRELPHELWRSSDDNPEFD